MQGSIPFDKPYSDIGITISSATAEIARVGGYYAVQGHTRSLMLVSIEGPRATSYQFNANLYPISHRIPGAAKNAQIIAFERGCLP